MIEHTDAQVDRDGSVSGRQYRLAWRWIESGTEGHGPWMHQAEIVEAWKDSLNHRYQNQVEHWVEDSLAVSS